MSDVATWYLVLELAASVVSPMRENTPLLGPVTEQQCEATKASINPLPNVISARCRKAVGMMSMAGPTPGAGYARPIFEGELTVSVGSTR